MRGSSMAASDSASGENLEHKRGFLDKVRDNIQKISIQHFFEHQNGTKLPYVKELRESAELITIFLKGPIDVNTVPVVCTDFQGKLERYLDKNILLDFEEVTHVDSSTVADLILLLGQLQQRHRKLGVTHAGGILENYIEIDNLRPLIRIYSDEAEALRELS